MNRAISAIGFLAGSLWATVSLQSEAYHLTNRSSGVGPTPAWTPPPGTVEVIPAPLWAVIGAGLLAAGLAYWVVALIEERQRLNRVRQADIEG